MVTFNKYIYHEALYSVKALGKLTSGLSVVDSEAGTERPENVRKALSQHALAGMRSLG